MSAISDPDELLARRLDLLLQQTSGITIAELESMPPHTLARLWRAQSQPTFLPSPNRQDIVAFKPCGCLGLAADRESVDWQTALELARCVALGWTPGVLPVEQICAHSWSCDACKVKTTPALPVLGDEGGEGWRVRGKITFRVTFDVDGIVVGPSEDAAGEALNASMLWFHSNEEQVSIEWEDDSLSFSPMPDVSNLSHDGAEQLAMVL